MTEECADALVQLRADDVFEFAGLRVRFGIVNRESVFEKTFGETMPADDVAGALASHGGKLRFAILQCN
jgi:hypothetical protein